MEGLRDSKLEECQQWGQNTAERIGTIGEEGPLKYPPPNPTIMPTSHTQAVLPLGGAVLPLSTVKTAQRDKKTQVVDLPER